MKSSLVTQPQERPLATPPRPGEKQKTELQGTDLRSSISCSWFYTLGGTLTKSLLPSLSIAGITVCWMFTT